MKKKSFVNKTNTLSRPEGKYAQIINQIANDGVCPFCDKYLEKYHKLPIINKKYWLITDNMYPYKPSKNHCLFIHKEHISHLRELGREAWDELQTIANEEAKKRNIVGGTLIMRFGDTKYTGASVSHLHAHIVQSDPDDPSYKKNKGVIMRIG